MLFERGGVARDVDKDDIVPDMAARFNQAQMVAARFRRPELAGVMALISTIAFGPYLALQMKGAGYVLEEKLELGTGIAIGAPAAPG